MAQSLEKRLGSRVEEFVRDVGLFGYHPTETKFGIKDHLSAVKVIKKYRPDEPGYGYNPKISIPDGRNLGELVLDAVIQKVSKNEERLANAKVEHQKEIERLKAEIEYLRLQINLRQDERQNLGRVMDILAYCET